MSKYYMQQTSHTFLYISLLFLFLGIVFLWYFGFISKEKLIEMKKIRSFKDLSILKNFFTAKKLSIPLNSPVTHNANFNNGINIATPPSEVSDWCFIQNKVVGSNTIDPISIQTIGYDINNNCCIDRVYGFNCVLNKTLNIDYCYKGLVGNDLISWVIIDNNIRGNVSNLNEYLENQDKQYLGRILCRNEIYNG